jgi:hypothetical protein
MAPTRRKYLAAALVAAVALALLSAGCSNRSEEELAYRNSFKKIWDRSMTDTETARKNIDKAYAAGDVNAAAGEYGKLGLTYAKAREQIRKLKEPAGYATIRKLAVSYFNEGASYYTTTARIVGDSGGNYDTAQEAELKAKEKKWNASAKDLEKALKAKRIELK